MKKLFYILTAILAATSCIYDFDAGDTGISDRVVIEGDISLGDECVFSARPVRELGNRKYKDVLLPEALFTVEDESGVSYSALQKNEKAAVIDLTAAPSGRKYSGASATLMSTWYSTLPLSMMPISANSDRNAFRMPPPAMAVSTMDPLRP